MGGLPFSRAMYGDWNVSHLASLGFDATVLRVGSPPIVRWEKKVLRKVKKESQQALAENMTIVVDEHYDGAAFEEGDSRLGINYTRVVTRNGFREPMEPSPVDEVYWREWVEKCTLFVANLSLHYPIWGMIWDMEAYRLSETAPAEHRWGQDMYSYDYQAFHNFANETGRQFPDIAPGERFRFLENEGLLEEFQGWEERKIYQMARNTAQKVRDINPNLSLGVLAFKEAWVVWNVTLGFNTSVVPLTLWTEHPYGGYDSLKYEKLKEWWQLHAAEVNGVLIPGFWTAKIRPFELIDDMEQAARNEGVMWIYQGTDPFKLADEGAYETAYRLVHKHIFFNQSRASPLPTLSLYPVVEASPYRGPQNTTVLLQAHHLSDVISDRVTIYSENKDLTYVGVNLSEKRLTTPNISLDETPCMISGIPWNDLLLSQAKGMVRELEFLIDSAKWLGITLPTCKTSLKTGMQHIENGDYEMAASSLSPGLEKGYTDIFETVVPLVDNPPPDVSPPPSIAGIKIQVAARLMSEGSSQDAKVYMISGLKEWTTEVNEFSCFIPSIVCLLMVLAILGENQEIGLARFFLD